MEFWKYSEKELLTKIGAKLKFMRVQGDFSQSEIATKIGMSRSSISDMENGKNFTMASLIAYLGAINKMEMLNKFFTENEAPISPIALHKLKQKERKRGGYKK